MMRTLWMPAATLFAGFVAGVGLVIVSAGPGDSARQLSAQAAPPSRYEADCWTIGGGLGGLCVEVTDLTAGRLYLYHQEANLPDFSRDNKAGQSASQPFKLMLEVDLTSSGKPELAVTRHDAAPRKK